MTSKVVIWLFLSGSFIFSSLIKENETEKIKKAFVDAFNQSSYEDFHGLFEKGTKSRYTLLSLQKTIEGIKAQTGIIRRMEFRKSEGKKHFFWSHHNYISLEITFELNKIGAITKYNIANPTPIEFPKLIRNISKMNLPFEGEWCVFWGGITVSDNYHAAYKTQQGAFDFVIKDQSGSLFKTSGKENKDYYAWGKNIIAPCNGEIVKIIKGVKDNIWPSINKRQAYGNTIVMETANNEFLVFAHLMYNSIAVVEGQTIQTGDVLGRCGNSGNSTDPHLHFSIQNRLEFGIATGARCYFNQIVVDGEQKTDYMPLRGQRIKND